MTELAPNTTNEREFNNSVTSFIEKEEEEKAKLLITGHLKDLIEEREKSEAKILSEGHLNFLPPRVCGYYLAVKLYIGNETLSEVTNSIGEKIKIINPEVALDANKWRSCTGLVLAVGPDAYRGKRFEERSGPWAKVGDWVVFPRHEGTQFNYRGIPMYFVPDDRLFAIVDDPSYVTRD